MKKTVSTSIGGVVFHIEEDAYQRLSTYLQGILNYFSNAAEGREIYRDIEARIAELLLATLKADSREAVNLADVDRVTATMGSVDDFAAAEAEAAADAGYTRPLGGDASNTTYQTPNFGSGYEPGSGTGGRFGNEAYTTPQGTWYRARKDRVVSGVLGGLAARLGMDALWLRVGFMVLFLGLWIAPPHGFGIFLGVAYVILAFVLPEFPNEEQYSARRFFREPNGEVVGGVAGGLAAYFKTDTTLIRILFVLSVLFFGFGIGLYLLLWIFAPVAKTHTDRMKMQGEPINLSGFNERLSNFTKAEPGQKSRLERVLLIPFEAAGIVLKAMATVLLGLARVLGAAIGIVLICLALAAITVAVIVVVQMFTYGALVTDHGSLFNIDDQEALAYFSVVPQALVYTVVAFVFIFSIGTFLSGASLIVARRVGHKYLHGTLTAAAILLVVAFFVQFPFVLRQFSERGNYAVTSYYSVPQSPAVFTVAVPEVAAPGGFRDHRVHLELRSTDSDSLSLVQSAEGRGATRSEAVSSAQAVKFRAWTTDDTLLNLDRSFTLEEDKAYRLQQMNLTLRVPNGVPFRLTPQSVDMAWGDLYNVAEGYEPSELAEHVLMFRRGKLACTDCPTKVSREDDNEDRDWDSESEARATSDTEDFTPRVDISTDDGQRAKGRVERASLSADGLEATIRDDRTGEKVQVHVDSDTIKMRRRSR